MSEETKEKTYLSTLLTKVDQQIAQINKAIQGKSDEIEEMYKHMQDHKRDMDNLEKNAMREVIRNYTVQGDHR